MSNVKTIGMVDYKKDQAKRYWNMVKIALREEYEGLSTREIKIKLDEYVRQVKQRQHEAIYEHERIFILADSPKIRTIQRVLESLMREKLVEHNGNKYKLTRAAHDVRYWSDELGWYSLLNAAGCFYPTVSRLNQNVNNLINMFGTYVLFCFVEASRRNPELKLRLDEYDQNDEKERVRGFGDIDNMTLEAVKNLFDPLQMYRMFLATMKAQPTEEEIEDTIKKRFKIIDKDIMVYIDENGKQSNPPSIDDLSHLHFRYEASTASAYERTHNTIYELGPTKISAIVEELEKRDPLLFKALSRTKEDLIK